MRRNLIFNSFLQLVLMILIAVLLNMWASSSFVRMDLTQDRIYSLDLVTRSLAWRLEKPLHAKVYFTDDLQTPYNNHKSILLDRLEELQAYSRGWMSIQHVDPTNVKELEAEAQRFGIQSIQYRFRNRNIDELKKVYMGF